MTYYYFAKVRTGWGGQDEWIVVFEQGCMGKPVCLLDESSMNRLIKEWNENLKLPKLKQKLQEKK